MPDKIHEHYALTITTLTPLHIGTGDTLLRDYDFVVRRGRTWVVNDERVAELVYDRDTTDFASMIDGAPVSDLLTDEDYDPGSPLFRYVMSGEPRAQSSGARIQEQMKNAWDEPYIPGSSLKGALRTAVLFGAWEQGGKAFGIDNLYENQRGRVRYPDRDAAQKVEHEKLVGAVADKRRNAPNYDIMRAVQVTDSDADADKRLRLLNVTVIAGEKATKGAPVELEAIPRNVEFQARLTLDRYLLDRQSKGLRWNKTQRRLINNLPQVVNFWTQQRLLNDASRQRWGSWRRSFESIVEHYSKGQLAGNEFIMQLGWGGGWDSKTLGAHLTADANTFAQIIKIYGKRMDRQDTFRTGDRFPKSRRVAVKEDRPLYTLGWIKVRMEPLA